MAMNSVSGIGGSAPRVNRQGARSGNSQKDPSSAEERAKKAANEKFQGQEQAQGNPGLWTRIKCGVRGAAQGGVQGVMQALAQTNFDQVRRQDEAYLKDVFEKSDIADLFQEMPELYQRLAKESGWLATFIGEKQVDGLLLHLLANLARKKIADEKLTVPLNPKLSTIKLGVWAALDLLKTVGPDLTKAAAEELKLRQAEEAKQKEELKDKLPKDRKKAAEELKLKQAEESKQRLEAKLAEKAAFNQFYNYLFPQGDPYRKLIDRVPCAKRTFEQKAIEKMKVYFPIISGLHTANQATLNKRIKGDSSALVKEFSKAVHELIESIVPDDLKAVIKQTSPDLTQALVLHVMAGISQDKDLGLPSEVSSDEFVQKVTLYLAQFMGEGFANMDDAADGAKRAATILNWLAPTGTPFRKAINDFITDDKLIEKISDRLLKEVYQPLDAKLKETKASATPSDDQKGDDAANEKANKAVKQLGEFFYESFKSYYDKDKESLRKLIGNDEFEALVKHFSPVIKEKLIKTSLPIPIQELVKDHKEIIDAFVLHAILEIANRNFEGAAGIPAPVVLQKITSHLISLVREGLESGSNVDDVSKKLIALVLPKQPWVNAILERYKKYLPISEYIEEFKKLRSTPESIAESKQALKQLLAEATDGEESDEQLNQTVNQIHALCNYFAKEIKSGALNPEDMGELLLDLGKDEGVKESLSQLLGPVFSKPRMKAFLAEQKAKGVRSDYPMDWTNLDWMNEEMEKAIAGILFNGFRRLLKQSAPKAGEDRVTSQELTANAVRSLMQSATGNIPHVLEKLKEKTAEFKQQVDAKFDHDPKYKADANARRKAKAEALNELKRKAIEQELKPLMQNLMGLLFENPDGIVATQLVQPKVEEILTKMIPAMDGWVGENQKYREKFKELIPQNPNGTSSPNYMPAVVKFCHDASLMAGAAVPYIFRENNEEWAHKLFQILRPILSGKSEPDPLPLCKADVKYLEKNLTKTAVVAAALEKINHGLDPQSNEVFLSEDELKALDEAAAAKNNLQARAYIDLLREWKKNQDAEYRNLKGLIQGAMSGMGHDDSPEVKQTMEFASAFVESLLLRVFYTICSGIKDAENKRGVNEPSLLESIVLELLDPTASHLRGLIHAKENLKSGNRSRENLIKQFIAERILHPALQGDKDKEAHMQKLTSLFFDLFGLKKEQLEALPPFARERLWKLIEGSIVPSLLVLAIESGADTSNLNSALLSLFDQVNPPEKKPSSNVLVSLIQSVVNSITGFASFIVKGPAKPVQLSIRTGKYQEDLEKKISELVQPLIDQQPTLIPHFLMKFKKFRELGAKLVGQPLGQALRPDQKPLSCLTLLEKGMDALVNEFQPCEWDDQAKCFKYAKRDEKGNLVREKGELIFNSDKPNFRTRFPQLHEKPLLEAKQAHFAEQQKKLKSNVTQRMKELFSKPIHNLVTRLFDRVWSKIEETLRKALRKIFGRHAPKVERFILPLARLVIAAPLRIIMMIVERFIWWPFQSVMSFYFKKQSEARAKDVELRIHDNLAYHLVDKLEQIFRKQQPQTA
jgi:hypothetical protein